MQKGHKKQRFHGLASKNDTCRMDANKHLNLHPVHRSTRRRMKLRKEFEDSVTALTADEEAEFETLRALLNARTAEPRLPPTVPAVTEAAYGAPPPTPVPADPTPMATARRQPPRLPAAQERSRPWRMLQLVLAGIAGAAIAWGSVIALAHFFWDLSA